MTKLQAYARAHDPTTSHTAAGSLDYKTLSRLQYMVVEFLRANPSGLTVPEIAEKAQIPRDTISPRMKTLIKMNLIYDTGDTKVPKDHTRSCIVWKATKGENK